ncbi:podocalyxin [Nerophis lumbriciformis]|uniref:podocalyxin n=1 Tax=Nerophis lumbriciformis TaxID=546530 RepID=UPI003BA92954
MKFACLMLAVGLTCHKVCSDGEGDVSVPTQVADGAVVLPGGSLLTTKVPAGAHTHVNPTNQQVEPKTTVALPSDQNTITPNSVVTIASVTKATTDKAAQATNIALAASVVADPAASVVADSAASVVADPGAAKLADSGVAGPADPAATGTADSATVDPADHAATGPGDTATVDPADHAATGPGDTAATGPAGSATVEPADLAATGPADPAAAGPAGSATVEPADLATTGPADPAAAGPGDPAATGPAGSATVEPADLAATGPADPAAAGPAGSATVEPADLATTGPADPAAAGPAGSATVEPADLATTGPADPAAAGPADAAATQASPPSNTKDPQSSLVPPTGATTTKLNPGVAGSSNMATTPEVTTRTLASHTAAVLQDNVRTPDFTPSHQLTTPGTFIFKTAHTEESTRSLRQTTETRTLQPAERMGTHTVAPTGAPTTPSDVELFNSNPKKYWYSLNSGHQEEEDKDLMEVCRRLMAHLKEGNCTLTWRHHQGKLLFDCVEINGKVKTALATQYYEDISKKATDNKTLIAILASCGALLIMIIILAVCASHHRKPYSDNQQHLTEELHTVENGYHDNPTLEVMEVQPEMQEKKVALNGDFGDSWIVPMDNLLKEDVPDEEDTHL